MCTLDPDPDSDPYPGRDPGPGPDPGPDPDQAVFHFNLSNFHHFLGS